MPFKAIYSTYDGKRVILTDQRGEWKIFARENELPPGITPGHEVEFEYEEKQGQYGKFKVLKSMRVLGAAGMKQVGASAPRQPAPASGGSDRDEMIYIMGVTNQYVGNTGDTSVKALVEVGLRAKEAFYVVFGLKRFDTVVPRDNPDPDKDKDAPF